jgi:hypothetical protein
VPILLSDILQSDQKKAVEAASGLLTNVKVIDGRTIKRRPDGAVANTRFYEGDHWQNGTGYIGAKPLTTHGFNQTMAQLKEGFVSENVIKEIDDRHVAGVFGREPLWGFVPQKLPSQSSITRRRKFSKIFNVLSSAIGAAKEFLGQSADPRAQEADDALTVWWDRAEPRQKLKEALRVCLNEERALLRLFVPRGLRDENGEIPRQKSLTEALSLIHIDVVCSDKGGVFIDSNTQKPFGLYVYKADQSTCVELSYVNDSGQTVLQVLSDNPALAVEPIAYAMQGRLWMHEVVRPALITEQIRSEQRALNLTKTKLTRNVNMAGDLERAIMNAERPKKKVRVADSSQASGYREETVDSEYLTGAGVTNLVTGLLIKDADGKIIGRANPNISYRNPVPIDTFVGTRAECRESMLGQAQQLHIMISGDSTVSGRSREQARGEYRGSLKDSKEPFDGAGRWIIEAPLWLAAQFCDRTSEFAHLRGVFDCVIEDGPISPEERAANREDVKAKLLSPESAMSRNGVEDTDAELARIAESENNGTAMPPPQPPPPNGDSQLIQ